MLNTLISIDSHCVDSSVTIQNCEEHSYVLPLFDGTDPRGLIIKARDYFKFKPELDVEMIKLTGRHFQGRAGIVRWICVI